MKTNWIVLLVLITGLVSCPDPVKPLPKIISFTATPNTLTAAGDVKLEWQVENATEVSISPDVGVVTGTSKTINVSSSKTFTLTAKNAQSSVSKDVTIQLGQINQAVLFDTTKVADTSTRSAMQSYDSTTGTMIFSQSTPTLENLKIGDVIASEPSSAADGGYLRKVVSITKNGTGFRLETVQATLLEAIKEARLLYDEQLSPAQISSAIPELPGVRLRTPRACIGQCFEAFVNAELCLSGSCSNGKIKLNGTVKFSMGLKLDSHWSCCIPPIDWLEASIGMTQEASFKITGSIQGNLNKRIKIATYNFSPITITLGIPLVFFPSVSLYIGVDGSTSVNFEYGIKESFNYRLGMRWENKKGFSPIKDFGPSFKEDPAPTLRGAAKIFTYAEVEPKISLYKIGDFQANFLAGPELEAGFPRNPLWNLRGKIVGRFKFGVTIPIFDEEIKFDEELFNVGFDIAKAGNELPVISQVPQGTPEVAAVKGLWLYLNGDPNSFPSSSLQIKASDPEDGENIGFAASSDRDGVFTRDGDLYKLVPKTLGVHTITVTVTDSNGLAATSSFQVNVTAGKPTVEAKVPSTPIVAGTDVSISYSGQNGDSVELFPPPLTCNQMQWFVSNPDEILSQSTSSSAIQCAATLRFNTVGTRIVSLSATDNWNQTTTKNFSVTVQAAGPVVINYIKTKCNNIEIPEDGQCQFSQKVVAWAKASGPEGASLTYSWSLESNQITVTKIALQTDITVPPDDATTIVSLPKKLGLIEINPNACGLTPDNLHFYNLITLEVSNGVNSASKSFPLGCVIPPK